MERRISLHIVIGKMEVKVTSPHQSTTPSKWSLALERYRKQKEQELISHDEKKLLQRRSSTGDIDNEYDGLTPKLSREVERLSSSSSLQRQCSTGVIDCVKNELWTDQMPQKREARDESESKTLISSTSLQNLLVQLCHDDIEQEESTKISVEA